MELGRGGGSSYEWCRVECRSMTEERGERGSVTTNRIGPNTDNFGTGQHIETGTNVHN